MPVRCAWAARLAEYARGGKTVALWGGGAKAVGFLNLLQVVDQIRHVVDINPNKQGKFLPGTGQEIVSAAALKEIRPDVVILMNPIYQLEIEGSLKELGLDCEVQCVTQRVLQA